MYLCAADHSFHSDVNSEYNGRELRECANWADCNQNITLSSTGSAPVVISGMSLAGSPFSASGITTPATLNPGQTATLTLHFGSPSNASNFTGELTILSNSSQGIVLVNMSAANVAALSVGRVSCTNASITGAESDPCTVSLTGAAPAGGLAVSLASNSAAVTVPATVMLPANATSARFTASMSSVSTAQTVTLTAGMGGVLESFALRLNAAIPILSISATTIAFGNLAVGAVSTQSLTLTSTGNVPVTVSSATIIGADFTLSGVTFPVTLNAGQTTTLMCSLPRPPQGRQQDTLPPSLVTR